MLNATLTLATGQGVADEQVVGSAVAREFGQGELLAPYNPKSFQLRQHQLDTLKNLQICLLAGKSRLILALPTGAGKTAVASNLARFCLYQRKSFVFNVPALTLVDQTWERFVGDGIPKEDIGIIQGDHHLKRPDAPIQIATAQTLARRDIPKADFVVIDECHVRHKIYDRWMELPEAQDTIFLGLSATPWSRGLGRYYQDLIQPTSIQELIDIGLLSKFKVFAPSHPDLKGIKTVAGDYHEGQLGERMSDATLVADVVSTWLLRGENRPTLCFAVTRAHAKVLADQFTRNGVPTAYVDAFTPRDERNELGRALAAGELKVVCNVGCLTTGIDWDVRCLILARPTKSEILFTQIIGRALRPAADKDHAIILDHSDSHLKLGMVTDIRYNSLDCSEPGSRSSETRTRDQMLPLPRECPCCSALMPAATLTCLECGTTIKPPMKIMVADGELEEFRSKRKSVTAGELLRHKSPHEVWKQLRWIQFQRERKDGWTAHTFKEIYDYWPSYDKSENPSPPSPEVLSYVRGKDLRYAKGMNKGVRNAAA